MSTRVSAMSPSSPLAHDATTAEWKAAHDELKTTDALWRSLAFTRFQYDDLGGLHENRRCPVCGSTLSHPISIQEALAICHEQASLQARSLEAVTTAQALACTRIAPKRATVDGAPGARDGR